jgi:hypothetical protein
VVCARPRWMHASCQWQRLSKAAAEGGVSKLSSLETAENVFLRRGEYVGGLKDDYAKQQVRSTCRMRVRRRMI